jgi:hypothetical protein
MGGAAATNAIRGAARYDTLSSCRYRRPVARRLAFGTLAVALLGVVAVFSMHGIEAHALSGAHGGALADRDSHATSRPAHVAPALAHHAARHGAPDDGTSPIGPSPGSSDTSGDEEQHADLPIAASHVALCAALVLAAAALARPDLLGRKLNVGRLQQLDTALLTIDPPVPRRVLAFT